MKQITIIGGSGFVGSSLVAKLDRAGYQVKVLTRNREKAKHLILLPNVRVLNCDIFTHHQLKAALQGSDVVINLLGILHPTSRYNFEQVHHQLPRRLAQLCEELVVTRLIHISALQASVSAPSEYLRSKAAGENAITEHNKKLNITIFRPSVIFGAGDQFTNLFASLLRVLPVMLLACPHAKFQPIWVEDVTSAITNALENSNTYDKTYELGGPEVLQLRDIIEQIMCVLKIHRPIIGLNSTLSKGQAWLLECMPKPLMTRDNLKSMKVDNITTQKIAAELAIKPSPLDVVMQSYLGHDTQRGAYSRFRASAGRAINIVR